MENNKDYRGGCLLLTIAALGFICQVVFLTLKLCGAVAWHWAIVLIPLMVIFGLPILFVFLYVLLRLPSEVARNIQRKKRVDAEAAKYGMERQPGETTGELKKRIITRNLIAGEYSRKDLKDHLLQKFPDCASCAFLVNNQPGAPALVIIVKKADTFVNGSPIFNKFTDEELAAIYAEAIRYIDPKYRVTIKNKEIEAI